MRLAPASRSLNVAPFMRAEVVDYFKMHDIAWHLHANHALSSQVCCLNFLAPLTHDPETLSRLVGTALAIPAPEMLPVESGPSDDPWFVGFEWIGGDYLNKSDKSGHRRRGANATSADAVVRFCHEGRQETLLIEWKYTERYGAPIAPRGNPRRIVRYEKLTFAPEGPINDGLGLALTDFFYEPFYQLMRQQMLAWQMQKEGEEGSRRVRLLHISPAANIALKTVTAPAFATRWRRRPLGFLAPAQQARRLPRPVDGNAVQAAAGGLPRRRVGRLSFRPLRLPLGPTLEGAMTKAPRKNGSGSKRVDTLTHDTTAGRLRCCQLVKRFA